MPYGIIKIDTITFTDAGVDKSVSISGLVQNPTFTGNVTATGTISGLIVQAPTVTGTTANFASGVYTTQISGAIVKVPAGTAGAPSIQVGVGASVAPGLYGAGTDLLGISTGGAGRIFIDSTGQLGVGTSSPSSGLHLANATAGSVANFTISNPANNWSIRTGTTNNSLAVVDNQFSTERLRIDSSGRVGIGTTSLAAKLTVYGDGTSADTIDVVNPSATNGATIRFADTNTSSAIKTIPAAGNHSLGFFVATSNVERMRIDSSGRLLVGTSASITTADGFTPSIQVAGTGALAAVSISRYSADAFQPQLQLQKSRGSIGAQSIVSSGDILGQVTFEGSDGTAFKLGASITAYVDGTPGTNDMLGLLVFSTTADGASTPTERMRIESNGNARFSNLATIYPTTDNAVTNGGSGFRWSAIWAANGTIQTSDERAKTDVSDAELGFNFIKSLRPVSYKWVEGGKVDTGERDDDGNYIYQSIPGERTHWGFIAQEVKEAVDDAGVDFGGWILTDKDDPNSQQALRYDQFIAPLTKALQEAIAKIETLEAKVAALEGN